MEENKDIEQFPNQLNINPNDNNVYSRKFSDSQGNVYIAEDPREHSFFRPVSEYKDFFDPKRKNFYFPEFGFDIEMFENLCSDFCPESDFPIILNCSIDTLNKFCKLVYNQDFHSAFCRLSLISKQAMRRCYKNLAHSGNATAINAQNMYVDLGNNQNSSQPIQIVLDINKIKEDN